MTTREEFIHKISNITESDLINAFYNYMALYNLYNDVCGSDNIQISKSSEPASFDLLFSEKSYAEQTYSTFNGASVNIYDIRYNINCVLDDYKLHVSLLQQAPDMV